MLRATARYSRSFIRNNVIQRQLLRNPISIFSKMSESSSNERVDPQATDKLPVEQTSTQDAKTPSELPKLSPTDFRRYNHMAEHMELFHNHFRLEWNQLQSACRPDSKISASRLISMGQAFVSHLTAHHNIEEQHIFPILGQRMPAFAHSDAGLSGPIQQHREIHAGLDRLGEYLNSCKRGKEDLRRDEVKAILDCFGEVLWQHLEDEVWELGAERMRKYWSLEEMKTMPM